MGRAPLAVSGRGARAEKAIRHGGRRAISLGIPPGRRHTHRTSGRRRRYRSRPRPLHASAVSGIRRHRTDRVDGGDASGRRESPPPRACAPMSDAKSPACQQLVESTEPYAGGPRSPPYPDASLPRPASEHRPSRRKAQSNRRLSQDGDACPLVTAHARRGARIYAQTLPRCPRTDPRNRSEDRSCLRPSQPLSPPLGGIDECVDFHFVHFHRIARLAPVSTVRAIRPPAPPSSRRGRPDRGGRSRPGRARSA